jgi:YVTN family beta-propeller protein
MDDICWSCTPVISVIDLMAERETARVPVEDAWLGLTFHPKGDRVFAGGGSRPVVWEFQFDRGELRPARRFAAVKEPHPSDHIGDVALSPDGRFLYAANVLRNSIAVLNALTGFLVNEIPTGRRPYRIVFTPDGRRFFVSHWADGTVGVYNASDGKRLEVIAAGAHPTDMVFLAGRNEVVEKGPEFAGRLFVAATNTNTVTVLGVTENHEVKMIDRILLAVSQRTPIGAMPSALALSPDGNRLYVACSGYNSVAVVEVSDYNAQPVGLLPAGWHPIAAKVAQDGRILIANARGSAIAGPPGGSLSVIPRLSDEQLEALTERAAANARYEEELLADAGGPRSNPVPSQPGVTSPIRHVVYIVKGNRSYDEVLGDLKPGKGDPSLARFGADVMPNHHKLAREFVLLDNFYANAESEAAGLHWAMAGLANHFVETLAPAVAAGRRQGVAFDGSEPAAFPPAGYLWSSVRALGMSLRNYGFWAANNAELTGLVRTWDPTLDPHTDRRFLAPHAGYPDSQRAEAFIRDFSELVQRNQVPRLLLIRLAGPAGDAPDARAAMADHDAALGRIVEAVSRSPVWPQTAIFITEASAPGERDHLDRHRTLAFVASPYAKRGLVDSTHYTTASMLRTIELLLGLRPLTQFDAAATPMFECFGGAPDPEPYTAEPPRP